MRAEGLCGLDCSSGRGATLPGGLSAGRLFDTRRASPTACGCSEQAVLRGGGQSFLGGQRSGPKFGGGIKHEVGDSASGAGWCVVRERRCRTELHGLLIRGIAVRVKSIVIEKERQDDDQAESDERV